MIEIVHFDGPCNFLMCLETGPHAHPMCPDCGSIDYQNQLTCATCSGFQILKSCAQLPADSAARYLYLLGKVSPTPHPGTVERWGREGKIKRMVMREGRVGPPCIHFTTESLEAFKAPKRGPKPKRRQGK